MYPKLVLTACSVVFFVGILSQFGASFILDDAFIFARYAGNLIADSRMTWNPGGETTYGITSSLFLGIVVPLRLLLPGQPALSAGLSSLLCGILSLALLALLFLRYTDAERDVRRLLTLLGFCSLASSIYYLAGHFTGGMDTTFAAAFLTSYIIFARRCESNPAPAPTIWLGLWGGLTFSARPDLLLYAFLVPASIALCSTNLRCRKNGCLILLLTAAVTAIQIFLAWRYFDSPLPLSFYAKGTRLYGDFLIAQYRFLPAVELLTYLASYWYLWALVGADILLNCRHWASRGAAVEKGLLIATVLYVLYYLFFVVQIMPYHQRFYYPTLPALLFLAAQSAARLLERISPALRRELQPSSRSSRLLTTLFLLGLLFPAALHVGRDLGGQLREGNMLNFDLVEDYKKRGSSYWFALDQISRLPDDLVMATTEVGLPAALNPGKAIVDLAGLNETTFVQRGFSASHMFDKYRPDLLYMPHPHYQKISEQISTHPYFISHYEHFPASSLGTEMDLALWRDSRYYATMRALVDAVAP